MARTVRTKVYKFNELSDDAKQKAIAWYRELNYSDGYAWEKENNEALKDFCKIFPCTINRRGDGLTFEGNDNQENLTGQRLATYIWNNYRDEIYSPKQYWICNGSKNTVGANAKHRNSKVFLIEDGCPLTGYYMDNEILKPIFDFMRKPGAGTTFEDLFSEVFSAFEHAIEQDRNWQDSDECISENIEANEYEFTRDGKRF